ncbi:MAG: PASTA domain-containing protein [Balneolaceae bacterium]
MLKRLLTNKFFYISIVTIALVGAATLYVFDAFLMPMYTNYNEGVTVPDVTRVSLEEAEVLLTSYGLRFEVADRRSNSAFPANYVIDQSPSSSVIVKPNRKIYLTVNTAVKPKVEVPNVVNLSLRNAQIQLQNYGLEVGSISYESSRFKNAVLRQSIAEGIVVDKGATINLVISDGLGDKIVQIPEIIGLRLPEAQLKLREAGLRVGEIRFQPTKDIVPNTVLDFTPKVTELIEGESLTLVISERFEVTEESESGVIIVDSTRNNSPSPNQLDKPNQNN